MSDFGQQEVFCAKCVPKQAPAQAASSVEINRAMQATKMTQDVRLVNEQVRGADDTVGKPTHAVPN